VTAADVSRVPFDAWLDAFRARLTREHRSPFEHEWAELVARREEAERIYEDKVARGPGDFDPDGLLIYVPKPPPDLESLEAEFGLPSPATIGAEAPAKPTHDAVDKRRGAVIETALIEKALRLHVNDGLGRRRLAEELPGMTDWYARQILRWYRVGKPVGLWLDTRGHVRWGAAITLVSGDEHGREQDREPRGQATSPTLRWLHLPRL
jgi:hypothetical protein